MASTILKAYLSPDVVDYCIIPYLLPAEEGVKKNYVELRREFSALMKYVDFTGFVFFEDEYSENFNVLISLRERFYKDKHFPKFLSDGSEI